MWNLKCGINEPIYKTGKEQTCSCQAQGVREGQDGLGVGRCKLLHLEWTDHKALMYGTGSHTHPVINRSVKNIKRMYVWI